MVSERERARERERDWGRIRVRVQVGSNLWRFCSFAALNYLSPRHQWSLLGLELGSEPELGFMLLLKKVDGRVRG
jgi:hypothetical protein